MALDDPPTDEVKADQKAFFRLLYKLLVDADRGPRLPTLFLALGRGRVAARLLTAEQRVVRRRAGVAQERRAAVPLVGLADRARRDREQGRQRRKPRLGSCSHGTGPWPFQPLRRSRSRLRW